VENVAEGGLGCIHGLSLYVETEKHRILFDAGPQGDLLLSNAEALGVDLGTVDIAMLSHGHYDHGNGMVAFMGLNAKAKLYVRPAALHGHFATEIDGWRNIGVDPALVERYATVWSHGEQQVIDE
jgi:7,8-dihydropterin-6-yl-methyl-4-(beta-D-ribofuranosyl)aminobenzene 5'-phosphate synthase